MWGDHVDRLPVVRDRRGIFDGARPELLLLSPVSRARPVALFKISPPYS